MEITCSKCNHKVNITSEFQVFSYGCANCGSLFKLESGQLKFEKKYIFFPKDVILPIGLKGVIDNETYEIVGLIIKKAFSIYHWREYTLMSKTGKVKYLSETDGHWILLEEIPESYNVSRRSKAIEYNNLMYNLYEYTNTEIVKVVGFYEFEIPKSNVQVVDYINPPFTISIEKIQNENTTYFGHHISANEVKKIFNIKELPYKSGVGLVQPFLFNIYTTFLLFVSFALLILATHIFTNLERTEKHILTKFLPFEELKTKDYVSPSFTLKGSPAPLIINVHSNVDNSWANAQIGLVNETTNDEEYAQKDIEYYHGYTQGENWTEGSSTEKFYFCGVGQGTYHLVITPSKQETDTVNQGIDIDVLWNQPSYWNVWMSVLLLAIAFAIIFISKKNFEYRRWEGSSFSPFNK